MFLRNNCVVSLKRKVTDTLMKGLGDRCSVKHTVEMLPQVPKSILRISSVYFQTVNFCQITASPMQA